MSSINFQKIKLVAKQEFDNVVRGKRFFWTTLLSPIILAAVFFLSILIPMANAYFGDKQNESEQQENQTSVSVSNNSSEPAPVARTKVNLLVVDSTKEVMRPLFNKRIWSSRTTDYVFDYIHVHASDTVKIQKSSYSYLIFFPKHYPEKGTPMVSANAEYDASFFSHLRSEMQLFLIRNVVKDKKGVDITGQVLPSYNDMYLDYEDSEEYKNQKAQIEKEGREEYEKQWKEENLSRSRREAKKDIEIALSFLLAISIFTFIQGSAGQISLAVIEEKNNKLIDILFTCIKPLEFIAGKIIGICLIRIVKFSIYIIFVIACLAILLIWNPDIIHDETSFIGAHFTALSNIENKMQLLLLFIYYFLCGYLTYGALYAGFSSTVDKKGNTPAIMNTISIFIFLGYFISYSTYMAPDGPIATIGSILPLTSPFCMIARLPFGVANWQIISSAVITFITMVLALIISSRIYTMGVQLYGNEIKSKEIIRYLKNKSQI